jgi:hypothetical protein
MGRHHVDLADMAMAGLVGVCDQLAEPDNMTLGLRSWGLEDGFQARSVG